MTTGGPASGDRTAQVAELLRHTGLDVPDDLLPGVVAGCLDLDRYRELVRLDLEPELEPAPVFTVEPR